MRLNEEWPQIVSKDSLHSSKLCPLPGSKRNQKTPEFGVPESSKVRAGQCRFISSLTSWRLWRGAQASSLVFEIIIFMRGLSKGSISQLQESVWPFWAHFLVKKSTVYWNARFVQGAKIYPMPPNCPVLQWRYDTRPVGPQAPSSAGVSPLLAYDCMTVGMTVGTAKAGSSMEFCATCSFLLDGVAHHTVGVWEHSL